MKMKSFFKCSVMAFAIICCSTLVNAQGGEPGDGGIDPDPGRNGTGVPFDFGLSALVAAGIGYAAKKKYDTRKEHQEKGTETDK